MAGKYGEWSDLRIELRTHPGLSECSILVVGTRWSRSTPDRRVLLRCVVPSPLGSRDPALVLLQAVRLLTRAATEDHPTHSPEMRMETD
jgi:hypothetical protein